MRFSSLWPPRHGRARNGQKPEPHGAERTQGARYRPAYAGIAHSSCWNPHGRGHNSARPGLREVPVQGLLDLAKGGGVPIRAF